MKKNDANVNICLTTEWEFPVYFIALIYNPSTKTSS